MTVYIGQQPYAKVEVPDEINYGTHTLPARFATKGKPGILKDADYRKRRAAKKVKHDKNREERALSNQGRKR